MDELWHSSISDELERTESVMTDTVWSENQELTEICNYVLRTNGKRIRPSLCILAYHSCGGRDPKRAIDVAAAIEIIHNATLIHDDINDQGEMRRGAQAAYRKYSISKSIIAGDFLFAVGFKLIGSVSAEVVNYIVEASTAMSAGEFDQKEFEHNVSVTEEDYMNIIQGKTARLIECSAKSGAFLADADFEMIEDIGSFAYKVGIAFQIADDVLDVSGDEDITGKRIGSDIMEGKPTLPTIYAMQDPVHGNKIREYFRKKELDWSEVAEAIELVKKTDALARCTDKAKDIVEKAICFLDNVEDSVYKRAMVGLARYIVDRDR